MFEAAGEYHGTGLIVLLLWRTLSVLAAPARGTTRRPVVPGPRPSRPGSAGWRREFLVVPMRSTACPCYTRAAPETYSADKAIGLNPHVMCRVPTVGRFAQQGDIYSLSPNGGVVLLLSARHRRLYRKTERKVAIFRRSDTAYPVPCSLVPCSFPSSRPAYCVDEAEIV